MFMGWGSFKLEFVMNKCKLVGFDADLRDEIVRD
jgi:hypothetical protein